MIQSHMTLLRFFEIEDDMSERDEGILEEMIQKYENGGRSLGPDDNYPQPEHPNVQVRM